MISPLGQSSGHGLTSAGFNTPILGGTDAKGGSDKAKCKAQNKMFSCYSRTIIRYMCSTCMLCYV